MATINTQQEQARLNAPYNPDNTNSAGINIGRSYISHPLNKPSIDLTPYYKQAGVYGEPSKYDDSSFLFADDPIGQIGENRALRQTNWDKFGNATLKMGELAVSTFLDGTIGTVVGLGNVVYGLGDAKSASDSMQDFWSNPFSNAMAKMNDATEKALPNYYTKDELENPLAWRNVMSGNFWSDKVLKNMGFALGAIGAGMVTGSAMNSVLGTNARMAKIGAALGENMTAGESKALYKYLYKALDSDGIEKLSAKLATKNISATDDVINAVKNEGRAIKNLNHITEATSSLVGSLGESRFEAINNSNAFEQKLRSEKNPDGTPKYDEEKIQLLKRDYGNSIFGMNAAILTASNMIQFKNVFNPGFVSERNILGKIVKVSDEASEYALKGKKLAKTLSYGKALINPLTEGLEEGTQYSIQTGYEDFYTKKAKGEIQGTTGEWISSFVEALPKQFTEDAGLEQFIVGSLIGSFPIGGLLRGKIQGGIFEEVKNVNKDSKFTQDILKQANEYVNNNKVLQNLYHHQGIDTQLNNEKTEASKSGNKFAYDATDKQQKINTILAAKSANVTEDLIDLLESSKNATDEEIMNSFATTDKDGKKHFHFETPQKAREHLSNRVNEYKALIPKIEKAYDAVMTRYNGLSHEKASEITRQIVMLDGIKERDEQIKANISKLGGSKLGEDISDVFNTAEKILPKAKNIDTHIQSNKGIKNKISELNNRISELETEAKDDKTTSKRKATIDKSIENNKKSIENLNKSIDKLSETFFTENPELKDDKDSYEETVNNLQTTLDKYHTAKQVLGNISKASFEDYNSIVADLNEYAINRNAYGEIQQMFLELSVGSNTRVIEKNYDAFVNKINEKSKTQILRGLGKRLKTGVFVKEIATGKIFKVNKTSDGVDLLSKLGKKFVLKSQSEKLSNKEDYETFFEKYEYLTHNTKPEVKSEKTSNNPTPETPAKKVEPKPDDKSPIGNKLIEGSVQLIDDGEGGKSILIKGKIVDYNDKKYILLKDSVSHILYETKIKDGELVVLPTHITLSDATKIKSIKISDNLAEKFIEGEVIQLPNGNYGILHEYKSSLSKRDSSDLKEDDMESIISRNDLMLLMEETYIADNIGVKYSSDGKFVIFNNEDGKQIGKPINVEEIPQIDSSKAASDPRFKHIKIAVKSKSADKNNEIFVTYKNGKFISSNNEDVKLVISKRYNNGLTLVNITMPNGLETSGVASFASYLPQGNDAYGYHTFDVETVDTPLNQIVTEFKSSDEFKTGGQKVFDKWFEKTYLTVNKKYFKYNTDIETSTVKEFKLDGKNVTKITTNKSRTIPSYDAIKTLKVVNKTSAYIDAFIVENKKKTLVRIYNKTQFFPLLETGLGYGTLSQINESVTQEYQEIEPEYNVDSNNGIDEKNELHSDYSYRAHASDAFVSTSTGFSSELDSSVQAINFGYLMNHIPEKEVRLLKLHVINTEQFNKLTASLNAEELSKMQLKLNGNSLMAFVTDKDGKYLTWNNATKKIERVDTIEQTLSNPTFTFLKDSGKISSETGRPFAYVPNKKQDIVLELNNYAMSLQNKKERDSLLNNISDSENKEFTSDNTIDIDFLEPMNNHPLITLYINNVIQKYADEYSVQRSVLEGEIASNTKVLLQVDKISNGVILSQKEFDDSTFDDILGHGDYSLHVAVTNRLEINGREFTNVKKGKSYIHDNKTGKILLASRNTISNNDIDNVVKLFGILADRVQFEKSENGHITIAKSNHNHERITLRVNGQNTIEKLSVKDLIESIVFFQPINNLNKEGRVAYNDAKQKYNEKREDLRSELSSQAITYNEYLAQLDASEESSVMDSILKTPEYLINKSPENNFYIKNNKQHVGGDVVLGVDAMGKEIAFSLLQTDETGKPIKGLNPQLESALRSFLKTKRYNMLSDRNPGSTMRINTIEVDGSDVVADVIKYKDENGKPAFTNAAIGGKDVEPKISGNYPKNMNIDELYNINKNIRYNLENVKTKPETQEEKIARFQAKTTVTSHDVVAPAVNQPLKKGVINIYAGTNENADLSNFATRPFTFKGYRFNSVEAAFQAMKIEESVPVDIDNIDIMNQLTSKNITGSQAKSLGRKIKGLDIKDWDNRSSAVMEQLLLASFEQNHKALERLLSTGNAILTHAQDKGKWGTEFPKLLMDVRDYFNEINGSKINKSLEAKQKEMSKADKIKLHTKLQKEFEAELDELNVNRQLEGNDTIDDDNILMVLQSEGIDVSKSQMEILSQFKEKYCS